MNSQMCYDKRLLTPNGGGEGIEALISREYSNNFFDVKCFLVAVKNDRK